MLAILPYGNLLDSLTKTTDAECICKAQQHCMTVASLAATNSISLAYSKELQPSCSIDQVHNLCSRWQGACADKPDYLGMHVEDHDGSVTK